MFFRLGLTKMKVRTIWFGVWGLGFGDSLTLSFPTGYWEQPIQTISAKKGQDATKSKGEWRAGGCPLPFSRLRKGG
jgi:hypothetical protein